MSKENSIIDHHIPHITTKKDANYIIRDKLVALVPLLVLFVWVFRLQGAILLSTCALAGLVFEYVGNKIVAHKLLGKYKNALFLSCACAMTYPADLPLYLAVLGVFVVIVVADRSCLGLGSVFFNPVLLSRTFLITFFPAEMTGLKPNPMTGTFQTLHERIFFNARTLEKVASFKHPPSPGSFFGASMPEDIMWIAALISLICGLVLIARKVLDYRIPVGFILGGSHYWIYNTPHFSGKISSWH